MRLYKRNQTWWVSYYVDRTRKYKSLRTRDKKVAELIAADIVRKDELRRAGLLDPFEEEKQKPMSEHLSDFEATLAARGVTAGHVKDRMACLRAFVEEVGVLRIADLDLARASRWLNSLKAGGWSARTVNRRYQALQQFGRWLVSTRRLPHNALEGLRPLNEAEDRRRVRRALTVEEFERLLSEARERPTRLARVRGRRAPSPDALDRLRARGEVRALVYALAAGTGLRRGELRRMRWCDLDLDRGRLLVPAASAKSRREQAVELHPHIVAALRFARPEEAQPTDTVVPPRMFPTHRTVRADMDAAEIPAKDGEGRIADFHSLRSTFITWCAVNGEHPRVTQALARHASVKTTMNHYTDLRLLDTRGAVARLPVPRLTRAAADGGPVPDLSPTSDTSVHSAALSGTNGSGTAQAANPTESRAEVQGAAERVAGVTGLEPATSGLTGRRSKPTELHPRRCRGRILGAAGAGSNGEEPAIRLRARRRNGPVPRIGLPSPIRVGPRRSAGWEPSCALPSSEPDT